MSSAERERYVQHLFDEAADLPASERCSFLDRSCAEDASLRQAVERLLVAENEAAEFLSTPVTGPPGEPEKRTPHRISEGTIGRYEILGKIGQGGTSSVYLARRQDRRWRQRYAIKILRRRMSDPAFARRITDEARVLGQLDHPYIARLVDADHTPDGAPYIVMEYVHGKPITEYCDRHRLRIDERLLLLGRVCEAVQYAHHNLVVHRDLKPSNVLVDDDGAPKLLDFGLAKLLEPTGSADSTTSDVRIVTPNYASPEHLSGRRVTTASDAYSLGVILYELLCGRRPNEWQDLSLYEILAALKQSRVLPPSLLLAGAADLGAAGVGATSASRSTTSAGLARTLRGDLDRIALKALRFDPEERYSSPAELREDLERYRMGLPIRARSPTWRYRIAKFCRRNARSLAYGTLLALLLATFAVVSALQAARLARERDAARRAESRADQITRFLTDAFAVNSPYVNDGEEITARQVLEAAAARLDRELTQEPQLQADLRHAIGSVYLTISLFAEARHHLEHARASRQALGAPAADRAATLVRLAEAERGLGRLESAESTVRGALALLREDGLGKGAAAGTALRLLADVLSERGRHREGEEQVREALRLHTDLGEEASVLVADDLNSLSMILYRLGDFDGAEAAGRECMSIVERHPSANPVSTANVVNNVAAALRASGKWRQAVPWYERALRLRREVYGSEHASVANSLNNFALLQLDIGNEEQAERLLRESLAINRRVLGEEHPWPWVNRVNLAEVLDLRGRLEEAAELAQTAAEVLVDRLDASHPAVSYALHTAGMALLHLGRADAAQPYLERALEIRLASLPPGHSLLAMSRFAAARLEQVRGEREAAEATYRALLEERDAIWRPGQWQAAWVATHLADLLASSGRQAEALPWIRQAHQSLAQLYPQKHHPRVATAKSVLGLALASKGEIEEGCRLQRDAYRTLVERSGVASLESMEAKRRLEAGLPDGATCAPGP